MRFLFLGRKEGPARQRAPGHERPAEGGTKELRLG